MQAAINKIDFKKVGRGFTIAGAAISAAFAKTFIDFTAYETKLVDMAKVTDEPFDKIEAKLATVNVALGSSKKLMAGYYQVISAGVKDPVAALETLTVAAQTAKAAHTEQAEVVKGITKMMAGYEGAITSASEAADLLFSIEKEGQTNVKELIPVIGGLAKMSSDLGVGQATMAASMAVVTKTAGTTAEAATEYQAVLTGLMKPTAEMEDAFEKIGEKIRGVGKGYKSAAEMIKDLGFVNAMKALQEHSDKTGVSISDLFGRKQAMIGFSALGAEGFKTLDDTIVSVGKGVGGAKKAFKEWTETGKATLAELKNSFLNFSAKVGKMIAPMIKDMLGKITNIIGKITEWADANPKLFGTIMKVTAGIGGLLLVMGPLTLALVGLSMASGPLLIVLGAIAAAAALTGVAFATLANKPLSTTIKKDKEEMDRLYTVLNDTNISLETRKRVIGEINKISGKYGQDLIDEKDTVKELKTAHDELSNAVMKRISLALAQEKIAEIEKENVKWIELKIKYESRLAESRDKLSKATISGNVLEAGLQKGNILRDKKLLAGVKDRIEIMKTEITATKKVYEELGKVVVDVFGKMSFTPKVATPKTPKTKEIDPFKISAFKMPAFEKPKFEWDFSIKPPDASSYAGFLSELQTKNDLYLANGKISEQEHYDAKLELAYDYYDEMVRLHGKDSIKALEAKETILLTKQEQADAEIEIEKQKNQTILANWGQMNSAIGNLYSSLLNFKTQKLSKAMKKEIEIVKDREKKGTITAEQAASRINDIEENYRQKSIDEQKKLQPIKVAQAISGTALAVVGALGAQPWGPWNFALAGLVAAAGAAQIATVMAQPYEKGGLVTKPTFAMLGESGPERVLNATETRDYDNTRAYENTGLSGGDTYSVTINAIDAGSFEDFLNSTGREPTIDFIKEATRRREL